MKKSRGGRSKKKSPPAFKRINYEKYRDKQGRFSSRGKAEKYISIYRLVPGIHTQKGKVRYERISTVRRKIHGNLFKVESNGGRMGLRVDDALRRSKAFKKINEASAKGILVKIRGRGRGKKKDTTKIIRIFLDPKQNGKKKYLEKLLTAKIMRGLYAQNIRVSHREISKNKDFLYLQNPTIEVDYYG